MIEGYAYYFHPLLIFTALVSILLVINLFLYC